jgi:hypothetical protein
VRLQLHHLGKYVTSSLPHHPSQLPSLSYKHKTIQPIPNHLPQSSKMHLTTTTTTALLTLTTLATALPTNSTPPTNFYLLTTTSCEIPANASLLPNVSATSLFDPFAQTNYLLRLIGPGYNSLPLFNLIDGTLETEAAGPHGVGEFEYESTRVTAGEELLFAPEVQPKGNLGLEGGFLLTVGGKRQGWRICEGSLGQLVVSFLKSIFVWVGWHCY